MAVNLIVGGVTLFLAAAVVLWLVWPSGRRWIEAPKYQPLEWDRHAPIGSKPLDGQ